jgi:hypothetical protein
MSWQTENQYIIRIGGVFFQNVENILVYKGEPFFQVERESESGNLGISFPIYNAEGVKTATVKRNNIYARNTDELSNAYYFEGSHQEMRFLKKGSVLDRGAGRHVCTVQRNEKASPFELNVTFNLFLPNGAPFNATPVYTELANFLMFKNAGFRNCQTGIDLG